jgi:hypothetical protein
MGASYTFVFNSAASFAITPTSGFDSEGNVYKEEEDTDPQMWTSIGGTGRAGTYVRPLSVYDDPYSAVRIEANGLLELLVGTDYGTNIGLTTLNGTQIGALRVNFNGGTLPTFSFPEAYSEPFNASTGYWASYLGTYSGFSSGSIWLRDSALSVTLAEFTPTALTISAAAVPEPSTYAALAGLTALGLAVLRRRRTSAA